MGQYKTHTSQIKGKCLSVSLWVCEFVSEFQVYWDADASKNQHNKVGFLYINEISHNGLKSLSLGN